MILREGRAGRVLAAGVAMVLAAGVAGAEWHQFLGVNRTPVVEAQAGLASSWDAQQPQVAWSVPLGPGFGGACVFGESVLVIDREKGARDIIRRLRLADGTEVWRYAYDAPGELPYPGSRSTPATDGQIVYSIGPHGHMKALRFEDGGLAWEVDLLQRWGGTRPNWGVAQSPLLIGDTVYVAPWGRQAAVVAYDKATGEVRWTTPNPTGTAMDYQSPVPMMLDGRGTLVVSGQKGYTIGVDAATGRQLWEFRGYECNIHIPSPIVVDGRRVLLTGGYGSGAAMFEIAGADGAYTTRKLWGSRSMGSKLSQAPVYGGHIYGNSSDTNGGLRCVTLDGEVVWDSGRKFDMGAVLIVDGLLFILNGQGGELVMAAASPDGFQQLGSVSVLGGNEVWGPIAYSDGRLFLRDQQKLVCLVLPKAQ